jgi:NAD(P)-dependent dehydrogenase (short-subunit alcohol dehydrogenase family)
VALAQHGWTVVVNYRGNAEAAAETVRRVEGAGGQGVAVQADVASAADRDRLVETVLREFGRIDLLVNNAGMAPRQRADVLETGEASYDEVMAVNLKGPFFLTQRVAKAMIALIEAGLFEAHKADADGGTSAYSGWFRPTIVNVGSLSAYTSSTNRAEYCLSKAGVAMMTALYADRLAGYGIHVYEVRPGIIETDMTRGVRERYDSLIAAGLTPIRRWGQPEDVARAVVALAEGALPFSTGEVINVDGGFHLRRL